MKMICEHLQDYRCLQGSYGISLIETLIVLIIMSLMVVIAFPSFAEMLQNREAKHTVKSIRLVLIEARVVALTTRQNVVVCPTDNLNTCHALSKSIMSFVDLNTNLKRDPNEQIINSMSTNLRFGVVRFNVGLSRPYIRYFSSTGKPRGYFANITYCPNDGDLTAAKAVILDEHGRARISFDKNNDGIDERGGGKALSC